MIVWRSAGCRTRVRRPLTTKSWRVLPRLRTTNRTVELQFRNDYLRYMSTYVQFANAAGDLPITPTGHDTSRAKFLSYINSNYTVRVTSKIEGLPASAQDNGVSAADLEHIRRYAGCLRQHGMPTWPDPKPDGSFPVVGTPLAGQLDFGENRVQEAFGKMDDVSDLAVRWHRT